MKIANSIALIAGGASGIGEATVRMLTASGCKCLIFDRDVERGEKLVTELGPQAHFHAGDVSDAASVSDALDACEQVFGVPNIAVNLAGITRVAKTVGKKGAFPVEDFETVIRVNLIGTFNVCRLMAERLSRHWESSEAERPDCVGVLINTASAAAFEGQVGQVAYTASKAAIIGMALPMARDLAQHGIRVNTIAPGVILTPLLLGGADELTPEIEAYYDPLTAHIQCPDRMGRANEAAALICHIIENDYINAECIRIDAGLRMPAQ